MIKAIETKYKGYNFRSRLEARWAVFFDTAHIPYEYEPEGFDLEKAGKYLPDFYLPTIDSWFEVKPTTPTKAEIDKAKALRNDTNKPVILSTEGFDENTTSPKCIIYSADISDSSGGDYENEGHFWFPERGMIRFLVDDASERTMYASSDFSKQITFIDNGIVTEHIYACPDFVYSARSARFEFK